MNQSFKKSILSIILIVIVGLFFYLINADRFVIGGIIIGVIYYSLVTILEKIEEINKEE